MCAKVTFGYCPSYVCVCVCVYCILRGPKEGRNATLRLQSQGPPTPSTGSKIRSGPQQRGTKLEVAASPLPSRGPKRGQKCYITPAFSGVPNAKRGEQNQKWSPTKGKKIGSGCLTPTFLGAEKRAEMLHFPFNLRGPQHQARGAKIQKWSPTKGNKIRSGCLTLAFSGAQKRAEMLRHPCNTAQLFRGSINFCELPQVPHPPDPPALLMTHYGIPCVSGGRRFPFGPSS